jgi:molybdopterin-guanine dinucleotide biosynthesis protein A
MNKSTDITGAVLAGGKSSRMGRDKALLDLHGQPFIQRIVATLQRVFQSVVIISDSGQRYESLGIPIYGDVFKNCGPLAGVHSALKHSTTDAVFIVSCDLPLLTPAIVQYVVGSKIHHDVTLLATTNSVQPLCGLYNRKCLPLIEKHLKQAQYSVLRCIQEIQTVILSPAPARVDNAGYALMNVNTPIDYQLCLERAAE